MEFILSCRCFHKCPLSSEHGSYDSSNKEQLQRLRARESREQQTREPAAQAAAALVGPKAASSAQTSLVPALGVTQQQPLPTTTTTTSTPTPTTADGEQFEYRLNNRRLGRLRRFQEKYASICEESQDEINRSRPIGLGSGAEFENSETKMGNLSTAMKANTSKEPSSNSAPSIPQTGPVLKSFTIEGIAELIKENKISQSSVIVLVGAGMSTTAGVPDFRSPDTGIYANLQKYNLPHPEDVFKISYFKNNPAPFYELSKTLLPKRLYPTLSHYFVRLLHEKGLLLRCFSQNVDCLESLSGIPKEKLCLAHGSFETGHCLRCNAEYSLAWMRQIVEQGGIPHCVSTQDCKGLVKPDVKFFGERLDGRFFRLVKEDFPRCELLIIIGSSLSVMPFAQLVQKVPPRCPRLLINKTKSGHNIPALFRIFKPSNGLMYDRKGNIRDVACLGDCDEICLKLAESLSWRDELLDLSERRRKELDQEEQQLQVEATK